MDKIGIISTKKLANNQKRYLLNADFVVIEEDFISTQSLMFKMEQPNEILIITSQNTVANILKHKDKLIKSPVLCVGEKTKSLLQENCFTVLNAQPEAQQLISIIEKEYFDKSFTFLCGMSRLETIPAFLKEKKLKHNIVEVYKTTETPIEIQKKMDGILFFSPSGVSSYLKENKITDETCFCIGNTTAKALETITKNIVIANQPSVENVIIQCINYYRPKP